MRAEMARRGGAGSLQRAWMAGGGDYTRASRRVAGGEHEGGGRARDGGRQSGLGLGMTTAPNRYDGWDQRVSAASDESTEGK
jgi:hypothetical protein